MARFQPLNLSLLLSSSSFQVVFADEDSMQKFIFLKNKTDVLNVLILS